MKNVMVVLSTLFMMIPSANGFVAERCCTRTVQKLPEHRMIRMKTLSLKEKIKQHFKKNGWVYLSAAVGMVLTGELVKFLFGTEFFHIGGGTEENTGTGMNGTVSMRNPGLERNLLPETASGITLQTANVDFNSLMYSRRHHELSVHSWGVLLNVSTIYPEKWSSEDREILASLNDNNRRALHDYMLFHEPAVVTGKARRTNLEISSTENVTFDTGGINFRHLSFDNDDGKCILYAYTWDCAAKYEIHPEKWGGFGGHDLYRMNDKENRLLVRNYMVGCGFWREDEKVSVFDIDISDASDDYDD